MHVMAGGNAPRVFQTAEGWFYLSTMLDNYGRRIIAWRPCSAMKAGDVTGRLTPTAGVRARSQLRRYVVHLRPAQPAEDIRRSCSPRRET